MHDKIILVFKC